ncbi:tripartite tricarboxylate transporter substrate binding protein [Cupriavidus metallidurans]|uniref:Bug family tripartite tricarboxylate transporter substrate binding protein n=1 Tax=Cupriavidus TaxID=106589 RepID=UPI001647449E|nr:MULTISPECIES: tripartite tricarboxylate transporter substrate binding protein [Cupriavidus]GMG94366.1 ABC transporter substrate-binding protein [Cupriavidus sp. TKC]
MRDLGERARRPLRALLILLCLPAMALPAAAQTYPERPVRIVSITSAGTGADDYTRLLARHLGQKLGQSFVVENKPGANMILACDYVAKAAPDGYTLLLSASGAMAANPFLFKRLPYDPLKDFVPIARMSVIPVALVVPGTSPYRTVADLVAAARAKPGTLNFGTSSTGYRTIITAFNDAAKIQTMSVPYKAMSNLLPDLISGVVDYGVVEVSAVVPHVQSGKLRALAVTASTRMPQLKDVPTMAEVGMPAAAVNSWTGLFAPAGTPPAIVEKLAQATLEFVTSPQAMDHYTMRGSMPYPAGGEALRKTIVADQQMWKHLITLAGIQPE